jgi:hypothetical protein
MDKTNFLFSFPRSGNSWIRYIIEFISQQPTSGGDHICKRQQELVKQDAIGAKLDLGVDITDEYIIMKRHNMCNKEPATKDNCRLILLIRDYNEAIIRQLDERRQEKIIRKCINNYMHCVGFYDKFDGDKHLVFYEDLLMLPKLEITKIVDFLNIPKTKRFNSFFRDLEAHRQKSVKLYENSVTGGDVEKLHFHSEHVEPELVVQIAGIIKSEYEELYNKYLKRYG